MKITGFNPLITTENLEETVALFEALGFERRHTKQDLGESHSTLVRMGKDDFRIDISGTPGVTQARTYIRMNVDNFQEGYDFLVSKGFKSKWGNAPHRGCIEHGCADGIAVGLHHRTRRASQEGLERFPLPEREGIFLRCFA